MRYSKDHKAETHGRIVAKAAVRLREKGIHGVGVADLMKDAGLTHGGFYAHFESRDALVIEAFSRAMDASIRNWRKVAETAPPPRRLQALAANYLSPQHRDAPGSGCAIPALGGDIVRESPKTRRAFAGKLQEMIDVLTELLPNDSRPAAKREAVAAMATMVGSLLLSRLAGHGALSDEFLDVGREAVGGRSKPEVDAKPKRARTAKVANTC